MSNAWLVRLTGSNGNVRSDAPLAPHHLPGFITSPEETDVLFTGSVVLVILVLVIGSLYFRLHTLPERIAHGTSNLQFQLVAVLSLLALFTHNNMFWVAALLPLRPKRIKAGLQ